MLSEVLLCDLRVADARCVLVELGNGACAQFPAARQAIVHLVLEGVVSLQASGAGTAQQLRAGESALIFYGDSHRIWDADGASVAVVEIRNQPSAPEAPPVISVGQPPARAIVLSSALELAYISPSAFVNRAGPACRVLHRQDCLEGGQSALAIEPGQVASACRGAGATAFAAMLANLLLVHTLRDVYRDLWHDREIEVRAPNARKMAAVLHKMQAHLDRPWTVSDLAKEVGLSRSTFAQAFRTYIGVAPATYLLEERMKRATQLLAIGSMTLHEIAGRVGYRLESSFARAFKQRYGRSPKHFIGRAL